MDLFGGNGAKPRPSGCRVEGQRWSLNLGSSIISVSMTDSQDIAPLYEYRVAFFGIQVDVGLSCLGTDSKNTPIRCVANDRWYLEISVLLTGESAALLVR